jgi:hypothetical protein
VVCASSSESVDVVVEGSGFLSIEGAQPQWTLNGVSLNAVLYDCEGIHSHYRMNE